jgi:CDGSH-type Zn-finger protein
MSEPDIVQKAPYTEELEPGSSKKQPFCDGSHQGTDFQPVEFELTEPTKVWLCGCKHSCDKPFCDGSHKKL